MLIVVILSIVTLYGNANTLYQNFSQVIYCLIQVDADLTRQARPHYTILTQGRPRLAQKHRIWPKNIFKRQNTLAYSAEALWKTKKIVHFILLTDSL
jgi:hypothetical protein